MTIDMDRAVESAIDKEREAYNIYLSLLKKTSDINLQTFFQIMSMQELQHEQLLRQFALTGDFLKAKAAMRARHPDEGLDVLDKVSPTNDLSALKEGMELALQAEIDSAEMYERDMNNAKDATTKDLFYYLSQEERNHERLVRHQLEQLREAGN